MRTTLIIKGGIYTDGNTLLQAHYSGYFIAVDCTEFKQKEDILSEYSKEVAEEFLSNEPLTYDGVPYYECEYSPYSTHDLELLSDISDLEITNSEYNF